MKNIQTDIEFMIIIEYVVESYFDEDFIKNVLENRNC